jgi:hypothetical protein
MGWVVNDTTRSVYPREREPVPNVQKAWWAPAPFWTGAKILSLPSFDPRTVQLVFAILAHNYEIRLNKDKTEMMKIINTAPTLNTTITTYIKILECGSEWYVSWDDNRLRI